MTYYKYRGYAHEYDCYNHCHHKQSYHRHSHKCEDENVIRIYNKKDKWGSSSKVHYNDRGHDHDCHCSKSNSCDCLCRILKKYIKLDLEIAIVLKSGEIITGVLKDVTGDCCVKLIVPVTPPPPAPVSSRLTVIQCESIERFSFEIEVED